MNPIEILKSTIIEESLDANNGIRTRFSDFPFQAIGNNVVILVQSELSTLAINNGNYKDNNRFDWKLCVVVSKGEYVHGIGVGENVHVLHGYRSTAIPLNIKSNDFAPAKIAKALKDTYLPGSIMGKYIKDHPITTVYEFLFVDASQIIGIEVDPNEIG